MPLQRLVTHSSLARHERHEDGGKKTRKTVRKQEGSEKNSSLSHCIKVERQAMFLHPALTLSLSLRFAFFGRLIWIECQLLLRGIPFVWLGEQRAYFEIGACCERERDGVREGVCVWEMRMPVRRFKCLFQVKLKPCFARCQKKEE